MVSSTGRTQKPASYASLHSHISALSHTYGSAVVAVSLNPAELQSPLVFEVCGKHIDVLQSTDHTGVLERPQIVAANPTALGVFFTAFMHAFVEVLLGWPRGAKH